MKEYATTEIRNVALAGHGGSGKTSLAEAVLYRLGAADRLGDIAAGNTVSDYDPQESKRQHSINTSLLPVDHQGVKINLLDLPGRRDFVGEIKNAMRAADAVLMVLDAQQGVEVGTEFARDYAEEFGIAARAAFVNKLDKERTDFDRVFAEIDEAFEPRAVAVTLPVGREAELRGVIDLLKMKFVEEKDRKVVYGDIPAEMADAAKEARTKLVEAAAEGDDELMMKFLEDEQLTEDEILLGLKEGIAEGRILPVCCGSSTMTVGVDSLLNLIARCLPNPLEGPGLEAVEEGSEEKIRFKPTEEGQPLLFVFKTVSDPYAGHLSFFKVMRGRLAPDAHLTNLNAGKAERLAHILTVCGKKHEDVASLAAGDLGAVAKLSATHTWHTLSANAGEKLRFTPTPMPQPTVRMAVAAKSKADEEKIGMGFHRLIEQDPTLSLTRDPEIRQTILSGMGDTHLDVAVGHLKEMAKVDVELEIPKVPYRETITKKGEGQGKYKKQSGGRGQYGDCWIRFEPLGENESFEFEWAIVGGVIPTKFQAAVEKGLIEALERGVLSGNRTVGVKAVCYDGSYHDVDSSDMAFKVAASMAFKGVVPRCNPVILEPILKVRVAVPEAYMGDVMGDLNQRRGRVLGMNVNGKKQVIEAQVPQAEMFTYSRDLRSITQGSGVYEMEFDHYERVPPEVQEKIIQQAEREKEEG